MYSLVCVAKVALSESVVPHSCHPIQPNRLYAVRSHAVTLLVHFAEVDHGRADPLVHSQLVQADGFRGIFRCPQATLVGISKTALRDACVAS